MTSVFLAPHNDDEVLFGAYSLLRARPDVVVCLRSERMGTPGYPEPLIDAATRERETASAMRLLALEWTQWPITDRQPDWEAVTALVGELSDTYDHCFAPAVEEDGHDQHNTIGEIALETFGDDRVTRYLTYTRTRGRSADGLAVPVEPGWDDIKGTLLACYPSQASHPMTRMWFEGDQTEFYAI